jgi:hypothetical protein
MAGFMIGIVLISVQNSRRSVATLSVSTGGPQRAIRPED